MKARQTLSPWQGLIVALLLAAFVSSCGGAQVKSFQGVITSVDATSVLEWKSISVQDSGGTQLTFLRSDKLDLRFWRASHLREHMLEAAPITVFYEETSQGLMAVRIED